MYKGLAVANYKWVKGDKLEKKINPKNWKEKAYIKTKEGKVEVYPNSVTKAVGVDDYGDFIYLGDLVRISSKKKSEVYSVERLQFCNSILYQVDKKIYTASELDNIYGKHHWTAKVGNRIEGGEKFE